MGACYLFLISPQKLKVVGTHAWADPESFVSGSNLDNVFFLVDEGREAPNTTISGPSSARLGNAI